MSAVTTCSKPHNTVNKNINIDSGKIIFEWNVLFWTIISRAMNESNLKASKCATYYHGAQFGDFPFFLRHGRSIYDSILLHFNIHEINIVQWSFCSVYSNSQVNPVYFIRWGFLTWQASNNSADSSENEGTYERSTKLTAPSSFCYGFTIFEYFRW